MVSSLYLDYDILKHLSLVDLPCNFTFLRLRCLKFFLDIDTMNKRKYDVFHWLLKRMPFLEELKLELVSNSRQTDRVAILMRELFLKKQNGLLCLDQTLKSVTISMSMPENILTNIIVVKFFLSNAKVLELMKIKYGHWSRSHVASSMIEELQKAEVISSDAKVVIFNRTYDVTINVK